LECVSPRDALIGRTLGGKYGLEGLLGEGGMGAVYRARQIALERTIAVKVMRREFAADPIFAARFEREAKAAYQLDHANSVRVLDFGREDDGLLYIAMELLDGRDLLSILDEDARLTSSRTVDILSQVLSALAAAHELGIIHRDMKPENIMILRRKGEDEREREVVKVCDFGIAKMAEPTETEVPDSGRPKKRKLTTAGLVIGTPEYMSPEQGRGESLDARADLYSVGVILYLMLSGRTPFDAPTSLGIVVKHQSEEPILPSVIWPATDLRLEEVCMKAMRKRREDRYASAREMRDALRAAIGIAKALVPASSAFVVAPLGNGAHAGAGAQLPSTVATLALSVNDPARPTAAFTLPLAVPAQTNGAAPAATATSIPEAVSVRRKAGRAVGALLGLALLGGGAPAPAPAPTPMEALVTAPLATIPTARHRALPDRGPTRVLLDSTPSAHEATVTPPSRTSLAVPLMTSTQTRAVEDPRPAPPPIPVATAAPPETPVPPPFDSAAVRVVAGLATDLTGGARPSEVNGVVSAAIPKMTACYRASATASSPQGSWSLRFATDDTGRVEDTHLAGPLPDAVKSCISNALRGAMIHVDTGVGSADVKLRFSLR
jgi:serine/threonine-protein kinase